MIGGLLAASAWAVTGSVVLAAGPPVALDQTATTRESTSLEISLQATDPDDDPLVFTIQAGVTHGTLGDCSSGFCTYTPTAGYVGPDGLSFSADDGTGVSNTATVSIDVLANGVPVASDGSATVRTDTSGLIFLDASDPDFDPLTFTIVAAPAHGDLSGPDCAAFGECLYTPAVGFAGDDSFTFSANDGLATSNVATIDIAVVANQAPVASNMGVVADTGAPVEVDLVADDPEFDPLTYAVLAGPDHGVLAGSGCPAQGSCFYTSDVGYVGPDSFTFQANDGQLDSNNATVSISVSTGPTAIVSSGPLTRIETSPDLNCAVNHASDPEGEFFGNTACATLVGLDGVLYGPGAIPAGPTTQVPFTPVSQSPVIGSGSNADPLRIVTVVDLGSTGLRLTQTDSYVIGQEAYRTDISVANSGASAATLQLYRAGDCFLQGSDAGYGSADPITGAVACVTSLEAGARIQQWFPLSAGSHYLEAGYGEVWNQVASIAQFPDTCACTSLIDNGAGLSWAVTIPAGGAAARSQLTGFSPIGRVPLTTTKEADAGTSPVGGSNGYSIVLQNPNPFPVSLSSVFDDLPSGFAYVSGSTSGATSIDPTIAGNHLTWSGPIAVAASGPTSIHFAVTVGASAGTFSNQAGGTSDADVVIASGPTAPIVVTEGPTPTPTAAPTPTPTAAPTPTPTPTPTAAPTPTPTAAPTPTPGTVGAPGGIPSPTVEPAATAATRPTPSAGASASRSPGATPTPPSGTEGPAGTSVPEPSPTGAVLGTVGQGTAAASPNSGGGVNGSGSTEPNADGAAAAGTVAASPGTAPGGNDGSVPGSSPTDAALGASGQAAGGSSGAGTTGAGNRPAGGPVAETSGLVVETTAVRPILIASVTDLAHVPGSLDVIGTNLLLAMILLLSIGLTSALFNATLDANRIEIEGWFGRLSWRAGAAVAPLRRSLSGRVPAVPETGRKGAAVRFGAVLLLTALIYGFLSPDFGLDARGVIVFIALLVGLGIVTYLGEGGSVLVGSLRLHVPSGVRIYGAALAIAIGSVLISRLIDFKPGILYGFVASAVLLAPIKLGRRAEAELVLIPTLLLLATSLVAWLVLLPLRAAGQTDQAWLIGLLEAIAAIIFVAGLESAFFNMIPIDFMDGATVASWNRWVWAGVFGISGFLFWHLLLNQNKSYLAAFAETKVIAAFGIVATFSVATVVLWTYFHVAGRRAVPDR